MDFFNVRRFRKVPKPVPESEMEDKPVPTPQEPVNDQGQVTGKSVAVDASPEVDDDDDDDFITNEVKRRLKELRRNSFMMLIPEESTLEDDELEEGETSSSEERDMEPEVQHAYYDFESFYDKYCERMLLFDRISAQRLNEAVSGPISPSPSPRSASKKLTSPFRCLSLKNMEDETEHLQPPDNGPYEDLETAYVGHLCLAWEALHCQYSQLIQRISCRPENPTCYNHCAQQYQQFQVLLHRFIENEPFEDGLRPEVFSRTRNSLPKLLQVPKVQGSYEAVEEEDAEFVVLAPDLLVLIQNAILTFHVFLKRDKKRVNGVLNLFANQNQTSTSFQQVQSGAEKKQMKLKELRKKRKKTKKGTKNSWPKTHEEVDLLLGLIDSRVVARVLRMVKVTRDQLLWCEDKMRKLNLSRGKLHRDPSPILFPC